MKLNAAAKLAAMYTNAGMPCEIEAGSGGLVVYAADKWTVGMITSDIAKTAVRFGTDFAVEPPLFEADEPAATAWHATIRVDWHAIQ